MSLVLVVMHGSRYDEYNHEITQSTVYSLLFLTLNELVNVSPMGGNPEIDIESTVRVLCQTLQNKEPRTVEVRVPTRTLTLTLTSNL